MNCFYCAKFGGGRPRTVQFDIGSPAPRCDLHWRYVCSMCGQSHHFMATAWCDAREAYYCSGCATQTDAVDDAFFGWSYYFRYRSPWTGRWQPSLDRLEYEGRHPALDAARPGVGAGRSTETSVSRPSVMAEQWPSDAVVDLAAVRAAWDRNADRWDSDLDIDGDDTRRYISDGPLLRMLGPVAGCDVLDLGCGNGYLARRLAGLGARVTGVDLSPAMLRNAMEHEDAAPLGIRYLNRSITDLADVADASFDAIASNYVLHDFPDHRRALAEASRVLRPGGRFVMVITHPCFSCGPRAWQTPIPDSPRPEESSAFAVDRYFDEIPYYLGGWEGFSPVPYFHRPLREYWRAFRGVGLVVEDFDEPRLNERGRAERPRWRVAQDDRIPIACLFLVSKPDR